MDKIRKGDEIVVIAGKDKGKRGTVRVRVDAEHVVVEGVNSAKRHVKPNPVKGVVGGVIDKDAARLHRAERAIAADGYSGEIFIGADAADNGFHAFRRFGR